MPWPTLNDPVHDSQRLFRQILMAMSEPGTLHALDASHPPAGEIGPAVWGTLLTLCDLDTRIWIADELDSPSLREALVFHTDCLLTHEPAYADFALVTPAALVRAPDFALGSDDYPDRSTTLLVVLESLSEEGGLQLSGPGIPVTRTLGLGDRQAVRPLVDMLRTNRRFFPCGLDAILTCGTWLAAIPRSTRIEEVA